MKAKLGHFIGIILTLGVGTTLGVVLQKAYGGGEELGFLATSRRFVSAPVGADGIPEEFQGELSLFILAGQSNIAGRGPVPAWARTTSSRVFVFGNDYHWRIAIEPIDDATDQVDMVSLDLAAGFSPGLAFATSLFGEHPELTIGLIPCARGGSSIYAWRRSLSDNTLYGSCLKRVRAASTMGEVRGILFFQGEADAIDPELYQETVLYPEEWADKFHPLVTGWRGDLGLVDLPVVFAQIGTHTAPYLFINWEIVKDQQRLVEIPFSAMITTDDLALQDDVHFTPESYQTIGQRFAEAYLGLAQRHSK